MRGVVVLVLAGCLSASPALAATDVTFSGTLIGVCTLAVPTPGILALSAAGDLTSSPGGVPAILSILSVGTNNITVKAPTWSAKPVGYDPTGESLAVSYIGISGLSIPDQIYTTQQTSFGVATLPLTLLTLNARARNTNGFVAGYYEMKVQVTCS